MQDAKALKCVMKALVDQIDDSNIKLLQTNYSLLRAAVIKSRAKKEGEV